MAASLDPAGCSINPEGVPKSPSDPVEERSEGCKKSNAIVRREEDDLEQEKKRRSIFNRKKSSKTNEPLKRKELLSLAVASRRLPQEEEFYIQSCNGCVYLDVGGVKHHVKLHNFRRATVSGHLPSTRLGLLFRARTREEALKHCDEIYLTDEKKRQIPTVFFDRSCAGFNAVLDLYRLGALHLSEKSCALVLKKDLEYWGVDEMLLEPCCALKYYPEMEVCTKEQEGEVESKKRMREKMVEEDFGQSSVGRIRSKLWNLTEYPESGLDAQVAAFISLFVVIISTATFVLSTLEEFQEPETGSVDDDVIRFPAVILVLEIIDTTCVIYFTLEYSMRLMCSPKKARFILQPMNLVDLFAIVPFFLTIFLNQLEDVQIIGKAGKIVRLIRIMRILRVFKLVRHFAGLQSLIHTMHQAYKELGLLLFLISVTVLTVSCLVYFAERDEGDWSFVDSFWFSLMTLTTVGYDLNPATMLGKVTGGFCALLGIFILTLPIPIVVNSFASYYKNRLWRNEVSMKKRQRIVEQQQQEMDFGITHNDHHGSPSSAVDGIPLRLLEVHSIT